MARRTAVRPNISLTLWEEGELHLAHTPLSHAVGEGLGVRAKRCLPVSKAPCDTFSRVFLHRIIGAGGRKV
jgi:hypothetical protein